MKSLPWTFILLAGAIVLFSADYFPGDDAVAVLALVCGLGRVGLILLTASALSAIRRGALPEGNDFLPPIPPRR